MKKVLITRPADVAQKMADRLVSNGIECVLDPMLIPVRADNVVFMDRHAEDGFIFTSPRAVEYFCDLSFQVNFDMPAYCVGEKTAQKAKDRGFENVTAGPGGSADLAKLIMEKAEPGARLMHPCGEHVEDNFYETLKEDGFIVAPLQVYRMDRAPRMQEDALVSIRTGDISSVVFFSKRTAAAFAALAEEHGVMDHMHDVNAICISDPVTEALKFADWKKILVSDEKTENGLIKKCIELKG